MWLQLHGIWILSELKIERVLLAYSADRKRKWAKCEPELATVARASIVATCFRVKMSCSALNHAKDSMEACASNHYMLSWKSYNNIGPTSISDAPRCDV